MTTRYHRCSVEKIDDKTARLKVDIVAAVDGNFLPETPSWALMVLHEATQCFVPNEPEAARATRAGSPLAKAVTSEQAVDPTFHGTVGQRFVVGVKLVEKCRYPIVDEASYDATSAATDPERCAFGRYEIRVADKKWLAHLRTDLVWYSSAFSL